MESFTSSSPSEQIIVAITTAFGEADAITTEHLLLAPKLRVILFLGGFGSHFIQPFQTTPRAYKVNVCGTLENFSPKHITFQG